MTIYTTNHIGQYPIVGAMEGDPSVYMWSREGICYGEARGCDLVNVSEEPKVAYFNLYADRNGAPYIDSQQHDSRADADAYQENVCQPRVGCLRIKLEKRFDD